MGVFFEEFWYDCFVVLLILRCHDRPEVRRYGIPSRSLHFIYV